MLSVVFHEAKILQWQCPAVAKSTHKLVFIYYSFTSGAANQVHIQFLIFGRLWFIYRALLGTREIKSRAKAANFQVLNFLCGQTSPVCVSHAEAAACL
jgi:hypothetical protein